ncbi:MAG: (d)CMP kinase [Actinomycetota bacterium]|jgi:cytidylate kinase|nr:(d)CMP kinase [Actinomycetota bacterium]
MTMIAIDGPAGSGKSTIAAALAERLGVAHVDTGAYYRAGTLAVLRAGIDLRDGAACARVLDGLTIERRAGRTLLDSVDVEDDIRGPEVTATVSAVSAHPAVRAALLGVQRAAVSPTGAVVEGRDAGTVVVPDAELKVWLTASPLERAVRRAAQVGTVEPGAISIHADSIKRRDSDDASQMLRSSDAIEIDTTGVTVDEIVDRLVRLARPAGTAAENRA